MIMSNGEYEDEQFEWLEGERDNSNVVVQQTWQLWQLWQLNVPCIREIPHK
jgi:hypothetical protein